MHVKQRVLRNKIKASQRVVMDELIKDHNCNICFFCGSKDDLTKEHVIPQWAFQSKSEQTLINKTNEQGQSYMQLTVPACRDCNSVLLSSLEDYLKRLFAEGDINNFSSTDIDCIIWWLQSLGYKLQLMDLRRKFLRHKNYDFIPFLSEVPIAMLRGDIDTTPFKTFGMLRRARKELIKKKKQGKHNSLIVFHTTNKSFYFFHKVDGFLFIELPQVGLAFFFFFNKEFDNEQSAKNEGWEIIKKVYSD